MIPHILTLNAGSSSIKFGLYRLPEGAGNEPPIVAGGLVLGASAPVILTSRADDERVRLGSCAIAALYWHWKNVGTAFAMAAE